MRHPVRLALITLFTASSITLAQPARPEGDNPRPRPAGQTGPGGGPGGNQPRPGEARPDQPRVDPKTRQLNRIKQALAVDDAKWTELQPKVEAVVDALRNAQSGITAAGRVQVGPNGPMIPGQPPRQGGGPEGGGQRGPGGPGGGGGGAAGGPGGERPERGEARERGEGRERPEGREGGPGPGGQQPPQPSPLRESVDALRETLDQQDASADDIKAKISAFEAQLAKANTDVKTARAALQAAVEPRQQAVLILMGILE